MDWLVEKSDLVSRVEDENENVNEGFGEKEVGLWKGSGQEYIPTHVLGINTASTLCY
jgi:hypothetical protein